MTDDELRQAITEAVEAAVKPLRADLAALQKQLHSLPEWQTQEMERQHAARLEAAARQANAEAERHHSDLLTLCTAGAIRLPQPAEDDEESFSLRGIQEHRPDKVVTREGCLILVGRRGHDEGVRYRPVFGDGKVIYPASDAERLANRRAFHARLVELKVSAASAWVQSLKRGGSGGTWDPALWGEERPAQDAVLERLGELLRAERQMLADIDAAIEQLPQNVAKRAEAQRQADEAARRLEQQRAREQEVAQAASAAGL